MSDLAFRNLLEAGDVDGCRRYWAEVAPLMPQPGTWHEAEITMHLARTSAESVKFRFRAYSHAWLVERALPSALPDHLKADAAQVCPVRKVAVGIAVGFTKGWMQPAADEVRGAMEQAVLEAEADGRLEDAVYVSGRIAAAKHKAMQTLFGAQAAQID